MTAPEILIMALVGAILALALRGLRRIRKEETSYSAQRREERERVPHLHDWKPKPAPLTAKDLRQEGDNFRFSPDLFAHRARVMEVLEAEGFAWFSHYSSVDCLHDVYGIEVCGIREHEDARTILKILMRLYPDWRPG